MNGAIYCGCDLFQSVRSYSKETSASPADRD